ncbi:MAG: tetratricopeptide repeat protein [Planctomycetota bacterium]
MNPDPFQQAIASYEQGNLDRAFGLVSQLLEQNSNHADALQLMCMIKAARGRVLEAIRFQTRAIRATPDDAEKYKNLGVLLQRAGLLKRSIEAFRKAVKLDATRADAHFGLGTVLIEAGRWDPGFRAYEQALRLDPHDARIYRNLAFVQTKMGDLQGAAVNLQNSLTVEPNNPKTLARMGEAQAQLGDVAQAANYFNRALEVGAPDAVRIASQLLFPPVYGSVQELQTLRNHFSKALDELLRRPLSITDPIEQDAAIPFLLPYQGLNDRELQRRLAQIYRRAWNPRQPELRRQHVDGKIRVGFVSSFFRKHTVGKITTGLVQKMDRDRFEVVVISLGYQDDEVAKDLQAHADDSIAIRPSMHDAARAVLEKELDVIVYMELGMDHVTYFLAFMRLAPVQCVTWGHPETTGIDTFDYYLSSRVFEPDDADEHYTEKLLRLDAVPVYYHRPLPPTRHHPLSHFELNEQDHHYYCPQTLFKFHPEFDAALAGILRQDPAGRVLIPAAQRPLWNEALRQRLARVMPDVTDRITFVPRLSRDEFLSLAACVEVVLDTFPFGGGTTSLEVFVTGTPIVTRRMALMRGRFTAAYYEQMEMPDLVAESVDDYVALAVRLGTDPAFREKTRHRILENCHRLYENERAVRCFEDAVASIAKR